MEKGTEKRDCKDVYGRKRSTQKFPHPCQKKKSLAHLSYIRSLLESKPDSPFLMFLLEIANNGADLSIILEAIDRIPEQGEQKMEPYNLLLNMKKRSGYLHKERAIRKAFRTICELRPVLSGYRQGQRVDEALLRMQDRLKAYGGLLEEYLDLLLVEMYLEELSLMLTPGMTTTEMANSHKDAYLRVLVETFPPKRVRSWLMKRSKPLTRKTHGIWNESITTICDELVRIGYARHTAKKKTTELLNLFFPDIHDDNDISFLTSGPK